MANKNKGRKTGPWDKNGEQYLNWLKARHPEKYAQLMAQRGIVPKNIKSDGNSPIVETVDPIEVPVEGK